MWTLDNSKADESSKIRWELIPYFHGRVLDLGCGEYKCFPHFTGVDSGKQWGKAKADILVETAEKLELFASQSCDAVFSSHLIEHIEDYKAALKEWWRVVKQGGHLILYYPHKDLYPNCDKKDKIEWEEWLCENHEEYLTPEAAVEAFASTRRAKGIKTVGAMYSGTPFGNPDHKHDYLPDDIIAAMEELGGWDLVENQVRNEEDEYSVFQVFQKAGNNRQTRQSWKDPKPEKTCAVIRYGAFGDMVQASSIFPALKAQGFHVTLYCSPYGREVVKHDPHIDRFIIQGVDEVPPQFLLEFWDYTKKKYDRFVSLSESVEGTMLAIPNRVNYDWPQEIKAKYMNRNYLEWTHELAGVPPPYNPKFYSTLEEKAWARRMAQRWGRRNILWSLSGSSGHKTWPHLDMVVAQIMIEMPDTHVVLVGDELCGILERGWEKEPRVHCMPGKWTIRESMSFAEASDLIIGAETGLLNAAGHMDVPKIVTLSHSSPEMLTKHWKNAIALEQPKGVGCPKSPCRMMHFDWSHCMKHESGTAECQWQIGPEAMWDAIVKLLGTAERKVA